MKIKKITVLGSGVMGSGIAAHLVNAGFDTVYLLDILPPKLSQEQIHAGYTLEDQNIRNIIVRKNLNALIKSKPPQLGSIKLAEKIIIGNTTDHFDEFVSQSDWIIEVVPEMAKIKNDTYKRIDKVRKQDGIVTSNTSGLSIDTMLEGCSDELRSNFLITHFFNPVRYMKLLEIVFSKKTKKSVVETIGKIGEDRLGKGIVYSNDVPAFVGNRIGAYNIMFLMQLIGQYSIEEINSVFDKKFGYGGKPFSTCDLAGLDTFCHVIKYIYKNTNDECHDIFKLPQFLVDLVEKGNLGRKTGAGFFKREKIRGKKVDFVIDPVTNEYIPKKQAKIPSVIKAKKLPTIKEAIKLLYDSHDKGGEIYRKTINALISYSFARAPEISPEGIEGIDKAIKWGFNQTYGPGEILDIIGVNKIVANIEKQGEVPPLLKELYNKGKGRVYLFNEQKEEMVYDKVGRYRKIKRPDKYLKFKDIARLHQPLFNIPSGGRAFQIDSGIITFEILSKNGTINVSVIDGIQKALDIAEKNNRGLIIGHDLDNFSFGADLDMLAGLILRSKTKQIENVVKDFQMLNYRLKYSKVPVVVIKKGMALGGGCELGYGAHIRAAHDSFIGLVEVGVGFIPGGAGIKETLVKKFHKHSQKRKYKPLDYIKETFMQIAFAKVAMSAYEAKELGYLKEQDQISMNSDFLLYDAIEDVKRLSKDYQPPEEVKILLPGQNMKATLYTGVDLAITAKQAPPMKVPNFIRKHFQLVLRTLGDVLSGGDILPPGREFSELELLEMERKGFLRLTVQMSLKEKFAWLQIAGNALKKKPLSWGIKSILKSYL